MLNETSMKILCFRVKVDEMGEMDEDSLLEWMTRLDG